MASDHDNHPADTHGSHDHGHGSNAAFEIIEEGGAADNLLNFTALLALLILGYFCTVMISAHPQAEAAPPSLEQHTS